MQTTINSKSSPQRQKTRLSAITFSGERCFEGDFVTFPNSLCFKGGNYADRHVKVTNKDLKLLVQNSFLPIKLNLEHIPTNDLSFATSILDGEFGEIVSLWIDPDDANVVRGEVKLPQKVARKLAKKGLSMEFYSVEGRPDTISGFTGAAITYCPRVAEAQMMNNNRAKVIKFIASKPQTLHFYGSTPQENIMTLEEFIATVRGESISADVMTDAKLSELFAKFAEKEMAKKKPAKDSKDKTDDEEVQDDEEDDGDEEMSDKEMSSKKPGRSRDVMSAIKAQINQLSSLVGVAPIKPTNHPVATVTNPEYDREIAELRKNLSALKEQNEREKQEVFNKANELAIEALIKNEAIKPAEREDAKKLRSANPEAFDKMIFARTGRSVSTIVADPNKQFDKNDGIKIGDPETDRKALSNITNALRF